ncbi:alpha/beta hydrolase [Nonomuraea sp. NPDC000554]|uniref:alpha/beta hydrolase n=1 Tax=Nonomuraea sp. NPDC000554 TaxID=3154259 RepID=UPI00331FD256
MKKIYLAAAAALCLGALMPAVPAAAEVTWGKCPPDPPYPPAAKGITCGKVTVPVDWSQPDGEKIEIFVSRSKARKTKIGTLITNPGGPGNPGATPVMMAGEEFPDEVLDSFDIIGFDPRGVGRSSGLECEAGPITPPTTSKEFAALVATNRTLGQSCREKTGALFDHLDTGSVAQDVEAIRQALGEEKISFLGQSYGTLIGQQYAQLHSERLNSLVLDSVIDHSIKDPAELLRDGAAEAERALKKSLRTTVATLFARADQGALTHKGKKVTPQMLTDLLNGYLTVGGTSELDSSLKALATGKGQVRWLDSGGDIMFRATWCQDFSATFKNFTDYRTAMAEARKVAPYVRGNSQAINFVLGCQGWPAKVANPPAAHSFTGVPTLVASHTVDLATPHTWATRVHRRIPGSKLLTMEGTGHITYARMCLTAPKQCMKRKITGFLLTGKVTGTTCGN